MDIMKIVATLTAKYLNLYNKRWSAASTLTHEVAATLAPINTALNVFVVTDH